MNALTFRQFCDNAMVGRRARACVEPGRTPDTHVRVDLHYADGCGLWLVGRGLHVLIRRRLRCWCMQSLDHQLDDRGLSLMILRFWVVMLDDVGGGNRRQKHPGEEETGHRHGAKTELNHSSFSSFRAKKYVSLIEGGHLADSDWLTSILKTREH